MTEHLTHDLVPNTKRLVVTSCLYIGAIILLLAIIGSLVIVPRYMAVTYEADGVSAPLKEMVTEVAKKIIPPEPIVDDREVVQHIPLPEEVKAIYMSACVVGTPSFRDKLTKLISETEINSLVIDIKDFSGSISFDPVHEDWQYAWDVAECGARDLQEYIATLHEQNIFVIGRITVFQDPLLTTRMPDLAVKKADGVTNWKDDKGLSFIDVAAKPYWDHIALLVQESYNLGFDELNFDYVRYPSDGPMLNISFPHSESGEYGSDKPANLEAFFAYLDTKMEDEEYFSAVRHENTGRDKAVPYTSADLFGMTTTNTDDLSIGQVLERAIPYFDFVAPMVYPSHYPDSFLGLGNPNDYPYEVVHHAMKAGVDRVIATTTTVAGFTHEPITVTNASGTVTQTGKYNKPTYPATVLRTWIQDFDYGGDYDAADVRAQIKASYDAGVMDYMVWAPSNIYTKPAYITGE